MEGNLLYSKSTNLNINFLRACGIFLDQRSSSCALQWQADRQPLDHPWKWSESCSVVSDSLWPNGPCSPWNSPGQNTEVHSLSLLQGIFPTQGLNPSLSHCRRILYQLSHKGGPRILKWVAYPFSRGSSQPRNRTRVSCIAGGFFTNWAIREAHINAYIWNLERW